MIYFIRLMIIMDEMMTLPSFKIDGYLFNLNLYCSFPSTGMSGILNFFGLSFHCSLRHCIILHFSAAIFQIHFCAATWGFLGILFAPHLICLLPQYKQTATTGYYLGNSLFSSSLHLPTYHTINILHYIGTFLPYSSNISIF